MASSPVPTPILLSWSAALTALHAELEQLRTRAQTLFSTIAQAGGPQGPAYGPHTEPIAEDAAVLVDRRRDEEFAAASFDGQNIRAQATLLHQVGGFRTLADGLVSATAEAQGAITAQLGGTLRTVVEVTEQSLRNPLARGTEELSTIAAPMLRRVASYHQTIAATKGRLGRFRDAVAEAEAQSARLAEEVAALRGAPAPAPAAARRARRR